MTPAQRLSDPLGLMCIPVVVVRDCFAVAAGTTGKVAAFPLVVVEGREAIPVLLDAVDETGAFVVTTVEVARDCLALL